MFILVADSTKEGMNLRSMFPDFMTVQKDVRIYGCSIWVRPYNPTPLLVFNPSHEEVAVGEIIQAPNIERMAEFISFTVTLYPYAQQMAFEPNGKTEASRTLIPFFHSQHSMPDEMSGYVKLVDGNFSQKVYTSLWNDITKDRAWTEWSEE